MNVHTLLKQTLGQLLTNSTCNQHPQRYCTCTDLIPNEMRSELPDSTEDIHSSTQGNDVQ